jgi:hypothetical protein
VTTLEPPESSDPDSARGLYSKYEVYKIEPWGTGIRLTDPGPVFVLAYPKDPHARVALAAYAESCQADYPYLAEDLRDLLDEHRPDDYPSRFDQ